jgi:hypothetical protein
MRCFIDQSLALRGFDGQRAIEAGEDGGVGLRVLLLVCRLPGEASSVVRDAADILDIADMSAASGLTDARTFLRTFPPL